MPKQAGIYKSLGKIEGRAYYKNKRDANYFWRTISPTQGENVRTLPQFETLRLNSYEFGACARFGGWISSFCENESNTILQPYFPAKVTRLVQDIMREDTQHALGHRELVGTDWQNLLLQRIMQYQKRLPSTLLDGITFDYSATFARTQYALRVSVTPSGGWGYLLDALGATHLRLSLSAVGMYLTPPVDGVSAKYGGRRHFGTRTSPVTLQIRTGSTTTLTTNIEEWMYQLANNRLGFAKISLTPCKQVNGTIYPMHRYASILLVPFSEFVVS